MHEVQPRTIAKAREPIANFHFPIANLPVLQRLQTCQREDRVIQIRPPRTVVPPACRGKLPGKKTAHQLRGFAEQLRREPRDLEHFETQAHAIFHLSLSVLPIMPDLYPAPLFLSALLGQLWW